MAKHLTDLGVYERLTGADKIRFMALQMEVKPIEARRSFRSFLEFMMPDRDDYDNVLKTSYVCKPVHEVMIRFWEDIDSGKTMRAALSVPPQMGKTTHTSLMGVAWTWGRDPRLRIAVGTYNEDRAEKVGEGIQDILESPRYRMVFPEITLKKGGKQKKYLANTQGGAVLLRGRGSGITGQPVDLCIVDDPIKDVAEAQSTSALDEAWAWFSTTLLQRGRNSTKYLVLHTRWAMNDLIGRLCDPDHPDYDTEVARAWQYLNIKACDNDPEVAELLGAAPGDLIWPEELGQAALDEKRHIMRPEDFSALYMGRPVPESGGFFQKDFIRNYDKADAPPLAELRVYAASDHAVSVKTRADFTVLVVGGLDGEGQLWLLDCIRARMDGQATVEAMIRLMRTYKPITWYAEGDHIAKAIGPFLRKRMHEEAIYSTHIEETSSYTDKMKRAQSIRGLMAMGRVLFPRSAPWCGDMVSELLRFRGEGDAYDDQVDALSKLGMGISKMIEGQRRKANDDNGPAFGTWAWLKKDLDNKKADEKRRRANAGW
jgi:predicted phage terminase large subunit-like protein